MYKQIMLSLLSISCVSYNMDFVFQQEAKERNLILGMVLQGLYIESHFRTDKSGKKEYCRWDDEGVVRSFGRDIQALTCTHSFFSQQFFDEKLAQRIVKTIGKHQKYMCDNEVARHLNPKGGVFYKITKEMDRLVDIVTDTDKHFIPEDLQDPWYINSSHHVSDCWSDHKIKKYRNKDITRLKKTGMGLTCMEETLSQHTLLSLACKVMDFQKIERLLAAGADCKNNINNRLVLDIAKKRLDSSEHKKVHYFTIVKLLLQHGADPDSVALMIAAYNDDQEYAFLLLRYFANPYHTIQLNHIEELEYPFWHYEKKPVTVNACDVAQGEPKGWLKEMVDTIDKQRSFAFKYWFLRNHEIDFGERMQHIPLELVQSIMWNLREGYKKWL